MNDVDLKNHTGKLLTLVEVREAWPQTYTTTVIILLVTHLVFAYHVLSRKSRSSSLVSYTTLVRRKQYYKVLPALISHPTTRTQSRENSSPHNASERITGMQFVVQRIQDWQRSSILFNGKRLSGLPLLFYNSFILWNCRALEPSAGSCNYARLLWGLAIVALILDLSFTYFVLSILRDMNFGTSSPFLVGANWASRRSDISAPTSHGIERVKKMLTRRTIGSLTLVTSAVLAVFQNSFPFIPLPVIPFVSSQIPILSIPSFSYALCLGILSLLSHSVHPFMGIFCGTISGMLWASNITSFLIEPYWSNGALVFYALLCALSLKSSGSSFVPCIDLAPWDSSGRMIHAQEQEEESASPTAGDLSNHSDSSTHSASEEGAQDGLPLFSNLEDDHHRSPIGRMSSLENDLESDTNEYYPLTTRNGSSTADASNINSTATMRSRRAPRP